MNKMNDFELKIIKVNNGFICEHLETEIDNDGDYNYKLCKSVFALDDESKEDSLENREVVAKLLNYVLHYFGEVGSKHDDYRVNVVVDKNE